ncbi:zinc-finger of the MIZ type in Nse subunit-domain-containing protein [Sporodiniella umbellata]|nr:zinc-finger of the MIZ type in Nse subunit-domain-containing protein [Sporodiniella umbellata]
MSDSLEVSIQKVLDDFHLNPENNSKINAVSDNLNNLIQLIKRGENFITLHSFDCEELHQSDKKSAVNIFNAEVDRLETEYNDKTEREKYLTNSRYAAYRQFIWNANNPEEEMPPLTTDENADDEVVMSRTKLSFKCPITTSWLEAPMTSKLCKHSYTKTAIVQLLNNHNGSVRCPLSGCDKIVRMNILFNDEMLENKVRRAREKEEQTSATTEFYDVE